MASKPRKRATAALREVSLVKAYFASFESATLALAHLNLALGTRYEHGHKSRWERGERSPNASARAVMLDRVMPGALAGFVGDVQTALDALL